MKKRKRWQYYCDFCKKSGAHRGHMENHEKSCTNNPDRVCGIPECCNDLQELKQFILAMPAEEYGGFNEEIFLHIEGKESLYALRDAAESCPACMLAALRQTGISMVEFDYKKAHDSFWAEYNDDHRGF